jgi:preprotein translocase subunit SecF
MALFRNSRFDFPGRKWPFIIASLVLTVAGLAGIAMKGGLRHGIDFKGGALMTVRSASVPPAGQIRPATKGDVTVAVFHHTLPTVGRFSTISREISLTVGAPLLTAIALFLFGGPELHGFSFALVCGIIIGTYSSVFAASPIVLFWHNYIEKRRPARVAAVLPASLAPAWRRL